MPPSGDDRLSGAQHERRARILTRAHPAELPPTTAAVVLKQGPVFLLSTDAGDVPCAGPHALGLYLDDCRILDGFELTIDGEAPVPLASDDRHGFETHHHLTNPPLPARDGGLALPRNTISLVRHRVLRQGVVHELVRLRNHAAGPVTLALRLRVQARFDDLFIVKRFVDGPRGTLHAPRVVDGRCLEFRYDGRDGVTRRLLVGFAETPARLDAEGAEFTLTLSAGTCRELLWTLRPVVDGDPAPPPERHRAPDDLKRWLQQAERRWVAESAQVYSSSRLFDRVIRRAVRDLHLLHSRLEGLRYFAAGIPWFATLFGRDAAVVALQTLPYGWTTARDTLRLLAKHQATTDDAFRDAEPGKILHEYRGGELAHLGVLPQSPAYYGTIDATPLFLVLLAEYVRWSGDLDLARELRPAVDRALGWMAGPADSDGDGWLDYRGRYGDALINQGWKDSGNAIVNADGTIVEPPVALCEVQAYAWRAWCAMAALLGRLGGAPAAADCSRRAARVRERFADAFWDEALGCHVLARQRGGRPAAVATSNSGHVLWSGLATPAHAARVVVRLLQPDMFSGWGVRTLSAEATAYNPMSYHLGSVWPHDNAFLIAGFRRYGHDAEALRLFDALFDAASRSRNYRLPEVFCGYDRAESGDLPIPYPVACSPQGWAAGALPYALWTLLGLEPDGQAGRLDVVRPRLPRSLHGVSLRNVHVGAARVDLHFTREGGAGGPLRLDAAVRAGHVDVRLIEPAPDAPDAGYSSQLTGSPGR